MNNSQKTRTFKERDCTKTNNLDDFDLAVEFCDHFSIDGPFIGRVITNEQFNQWIFNLGFNDMMNHGWASAEGALAWNTYRATVRDYLMNGVMGEAYAEQLNYEPYILKINRHGIDLIICKYSDHIVDTARTLAKKRQKTIKNQSKTLGKGFDTLINIYHVDGMEIQMQKKLIDSHNGVRFSLEVALDEMSKKMESDMIAILENSKKMTENIDKLKATHNTKLIEEK